jgi:hypothetical protein
MSEDPFHDHGPRNDDRSPGVCGSETLVGGPDGALPKTVPVMSAAEVCRRLGSVYYRRGNRRQALEVWMKSLELEPDHPGARGMVEKIGAELSEK